MDKRVLGKPTTLAKRISESRKSIHMSQRDFAQNTGISQSFLSMVESGLCEPSLAFIRAVHTLTGRPYEWLIDGTESAWGPKETYVANEIQKMNDPQQDFICDVIRSYKKTL